MTLTFRRSWNDDPTPPLHYTLRTRRTKARAPLPIHKDEGHRMACGHQVKDESRRTEDADKVTCRNCLRVMEVEGR